uniref:Uncharacterized protein n=1 Tax=Balaenoptera musculus TaxID=9771 RepID=A0A8C0CVG9_BALMU
ENWISTFKRINDPPPAAGLVGAGGGRQVLRGVDLADHGEGRTHTGQVYDDKDNRKVRFVGRQKEVNENFTIHLIAEQPVSQVSSRVISCEGAGGPLPTPKCI